ncbi:hypothetical protein CLV49_2875 [Labedella gwakjiensis]|uniref:Uncharacterized protein n=1 Tax=Labedella gwakjiensis TaxID=390269 RepID=A0A2P8GZ47_9MICO|nr:hypothetical protein CLV49_2875 [Labedella gwakjiensis]
MAKNTGRGTRQGSVTGRSQVKNSSGTWVKRDTSSGQFLAAKKSGGSFRGIRPEG